jgi:MFS family permease
MTEVLSPTVARRAFLLMTATRWFPVGLVVGIMTLLPLERGLTISESLFAFSLMGIVVVVLELPTSGFADAFGRRPVLLAAAVFNVLASAVFLVAGAVWSFLLAAVLTGVFRALDSGPMEAWYVDTVHASEPGADVDQALARQETVLGASISLGALVSGVLIAWNPWSVGSALLLPFLVAAVLNVGHLVAVAVLLREPVTHVDTTGARRAAASVREAPAVVRDGLAQLRTNRVLRGLVLVTVFWSIAMVVFESFQPIRLAELLGSEEVAGAWMGPVAAVGWGIYALGATIAGLLSPRLGVTRTAMLARVLNGLGVVVMGLVAGPVALVVAYLFTYTMHGTAGPVHMALLHREAHARNRSTVLSIDSMMGFAAFSIATPLLGVLADWSGTQVAMVTAGVVSLAGVFFYLPALAAERARRQEGEGVDEPGPPAASSPASGVPEPPSAS